jgi:calpain-15
LDDTLKEFLLNPENAESVKEYYDAHDANADGTLDMEEFTNLLASFQVEEGVEDFFNGLDTDGSGGVGFHEFAAMFIAAAQPGSVNVNEEEDVQGDDGLFIDTSFPADESVVFGDGCDPTGGKPVAWVRAKDAFPNASYLFEGIEPTDVCQGGLGDCWLLAAISALAEFPGAVENLFVTNKMSTNGKYQIQLFDGGSNSWEVMDVDDQLAMMDAHDMFGEGYTFAGGARFQSCFTKPQGDEIWVPLLEKAFAKFCGTYGALNGGHALYAWQCMTGCTELQEFRKEDGGWMHIAVAYTDPRSVHSWSGRNGQYGTMDDDSFWSHICEADEANYVMGCSCTGGMEDQLDTGLVTGHAYSLIAAREVEADGESHKMICMRNPWGNDKEWNGRFSDNWGEWGSYPELHAALEVGAAPDGKFWMCWDDFKENWTTVSFAAMGMNTKKGSNVTKRGIKLKKNKKGMCGGCAVM